MRLKKSILQRLVVLLEYKNYQFKKITPSQAIKHPKWKMGKNKCDSSTLMNKILELIEAQKLFNIPNNKLDILILLTH